jgi:hypothetical protein
MEVPPLASNLLVLPLQKLYGLAASVAPLLAAGNAPLGCAQGLFRLPIVARVLHDLAIRRAEEDLQPYVNAGLLACRLQWRDRYLRTGDAGVPAIGLARDGDGLRCAPYWVGPAHCNPPDLRQDQEAVVEGGTVAKLRGGEAVVAALPLEAWVARLLASLDAAEEGLKRPVEP